MKQILPSEIEWKSQIFMDGNSAPFLYNGDFYKAIRNTAALKPFTLKSVIAGAVKNKFIPDTRLTNLQLDGFREVYWQKSEKFTVPPQFWSWGTLRETALHYLRLNLWLLERKLTLQDGHTQNIVFQETMQPKWCDIGSIIPITSSMLPALDEFIRFYLYPLLIGQREGIIDLWRPNAGRGISHSTARSLGLTFSAASGKPAEVLSHLLRFIDELERPKNNGIWTDYYKKGAPEAQECIGKSNRITLIEKILLALKPKSIIDIGANSGLFRALWRGMQRYCLLIQMTVR